MALLLYALAVIGAALVAVMSFPRGLAVAALFTLGAMMVLGGLLKRGQARIVLTVAGALAAVAAIVAFARGGVLVAVGGVAATVVLATVAARIALTRDLRLPAAEAPSRPVVFWNPRSGGGKAEAANLAGQARSRGIEPIELTPGTDLWELARRAVADGADALAAAGGDGTQAIVAAVASEHGLPFACIPAGTRNHFALDLGVDRDDVVGALDAFVDGRERIVDLGDVNGIVFVNNVSLGVYADAVHQDRYRGAKVETLLDTLPQAVEPSSPGADLLWRDDGGVPHRSAALLLVSNNPYRVGSLLGSGTRPRLDSGRLGMVALDTATPDVGQLRARLGPQVLQWAAPRFRVDSGSSVPVAIDGEATAMEPPLQFHVRRQALRVRISAHHPGASPSAGLPASPGGVLRAMADIAAGVEPM